MIRWSTPRWPAGWLSEIDCDASSNQCVIISDDRVGKAPARLLTASLDLNTMAFAPVTINHAVTPRPLDEVTYQAADGILPPRVRTRVLGGRRRAVAPPPDILPPPVLRPRAFLHY
jgi:hypothetical protein